MVLIIPLDIISDFQKFNFDSFFPFYISNINNIYVLISYMYFFCGSQLAC